MECIAVSKMASKIKAGKLSLDPFAPGLRAFDPMMSQAWNAEAGRPFQYANGLRCLGRGDSAGSVFAKAWTSYREVGSSHIGWVFLPIEQCPNWGPSSKASTGINVMQKLFLQLCCFYSVHRVSAHDAACLYVIAVCWMLCLTPGNTRCKTFPPPCCSSQFISPC